uniref:NADH-ubiquinone oxidoreductase chain 2 n=1 Tax=Phallocryptus tserensodnomi TaxID=1383053 RepID=A0A0U1Z638_9CRUS|nr:NADH dehydrogenase subunit 2 [Phallocryptus tserensodnomi]AJP76852.1 NADH dehydrogenase subunit 2 [Phallocryptus tserensodnomi]
MMKWLVFSLSFLIMLSSDSWLGFWMGLEINTLSFIPILVPQSKEMSLKYFLVQSLGSVIFLSGVLNPSLVFFCPLGLLLKAGVAPLHFWVLSVVKSMEWITVLVFLTVQKLGPLFGLLVNQFQSTLVIFLSILLGSLGGIIQSDTRLILAFSSISHLGWLIINLSSMSLFFTYFLIYCLISISLVLILKKLNLGSISQMGSLGDPISKISLSFSLLSLGGLPPLLGFLIKWMTVESTLISLFLIIFLAFSTCLSLFFYLKISMIPLLSPYLTSSKSPMGWETLYAFSLNLMVPLFMI